MFVLMCAIWQCFAVPFFNPANRPLTLATTTTIYSVVPFHIIFNKIYIYINNNMKRYFFFFLENSFWIFWVAHQTQISCNVNNNAS